MKNLFALAILLFSLAGVAQEHSRGHHKKKKAHMMENFTPEQVAELKTKKMTLALDLSKSQQDKIYALSLDEAKKRKAKIAEHKKRKESGEKKELSSDEKFKMMNQRLDYQIEMKKKMKSILTEEQFKKFEQAQKHRGKRKKMARHEKKMRK